MGQRDADGSAEPETTYALDAAHYDEMWARLHDFLRYNPGARHRRRLVRTALARHAADARDVLDVGCGLGETVVFLAAAFPKCRFTGVDFSGGAIESCRRRAPGQRWLVADVLTGKLPGEYDAVVCSELLEHLDEPETALRNIVAAVRPGGTLIVTVPNGKVFATERSFGHVGHPAPATVHDWFGACGLDVVSSRQWGFPAYLALKYAVNVDPERAMSSFGSGRYSWLVRRANDAAYLAVGAGSLPNHHRGPQSIVVGRRRHDVSVTSVPSGAEERWSSPGARR